MEGLIAGTGERRSSLPKITVVTPSYNQGRFLERCITSVLDQEYADLKYIIIDGGSTDESRSIIEKYAGRLEYWVSEPDRGQSDAINKGFALATSELVAWLNADDFYFSGSFRAAAEAYQACPDAPFYFGDGVRVDETGVPRRGFFPNGRVAFNREALIFGLNYILQPAVFINRQSLKEVGYLDPTLRYGMDTDLWIRLSKGKAPVPIRTQLAATREYQETKTATGSLGRIEELRLIAKRHSGCSITPGVLCYLCDTLDVLSSDRPDMYSPRFRRNIKRLWAQAARLLNQHGADCDGFPDEGVQVSRARRVFWKLRGRFLSMVRQMKSAGRHDRRG